MSRSFQTHSDPQATMSYAKSLATKYPRGVNIMAEADFFYPLPTKIADWYPTTKKPPAAAPKAAPKLDTVDYDGLRYVPLAEPLAGYSLVIAPSPPIHNLTPSVL